MDRLWAPWRAHYVSTATSPDPECIFCQKVQDTRDEENLVLLRTDRCFVLMNLYPYNNGHLLVAPCRHVGDMDALETEELTELMAVTRWMVRVLRRAMRPHGFNIGINVGRVAGAGIPGHFHMHIVPRWDGDTNFMPVVGEVKVLSEGLDRTYQRIRQAMREEEEGGDKRRNDA